MNAEAKSGQADWSQAHRWQKHLLVVDDDPSTRRMLTDLLRLWNFRVSVVGSAEEALSLLGRQPVDLVLTDLWLPGMNGHDLIAALRRDRTMRKAPVIVMTAASFPDCSTQSLAVGAADHLTKPLPLKELRAAIYKAIAGRSGSTGPKHRRGVHA